MDNVEVGEYSGLESSLLHNFRHLPFVRKYFCNQCSFATQNPRDHLVHLRDVHFCRIQIYECPYCLYASKYSQKLGRHIRMVHKAESKESDVKLAHQVIEQVKELKRLGVSLTKASSTPSVRPRMEETSKTYNCSECPYVTRNKSLFTKHMKRHFENELLGGNEGQKQREAYTRDEDLEALTTDLLENLENEVLLAPPPPVEDLDDMETGLTHESLSAKRKSPKPLPPLIPLVTGKQKEETGGSGQNDPIGSNFDDDVIPVEDMEEEMAVQNGKDSQGGKHGEDRDFLDEFSQLQEVDRICKTCGHESRCLSEALRHKKLHSLSAGNQSSVRRGTRCQYCRRRCKTELDLINHEQECEEKKKVCEGMDVHPQDETVDGRKTILWSRLSEGPGTSFASSDTPVRVIEIPTQRHEATSLRRVYKCPFCSFWAQMASKFHIHYVGHLNQKPFECSLCKYRSNWNWDVKKHIKLKSERDPEHRNAKVYITHDSGNKNYEKYGKYMAVMDIKDTGKKHGHEDERSTLISTPKGTLPPLLKGSIRTQVGPSGGNRMSSMPPLLKKGEGPKKPPLPLKFPLFRMQTQANPDGVHVSSAPQFFLVSTPTTSNAGATSQTFIGASQYVTVKDEREPPRPSQKRAGDSQHQGDGPTLKRPNLAQIQGAMKCSRCKFTTLDRNAMKGHLRTHLEDSRDLDGGNDRSMNEDIGSDLSQLFASDQDSMDQLPLGSDVVENTDYLPEERKYQCRLCPYSCPRRGDMKAHSIQHRKRPHADFKCPMCPFYVSKQRALHHHMKLHGIDSPQLFAGDGDSPLREDVDMVEVKEYEDSEGEGGKEGGSSDAIRAWHCPECPYTATTKSQYYYHRQYHKPGLSTRKCMYCSFNTDNERLLSQHMSQLHEHQGDEDKTASAGTQNESVDGDIPQVWVCKGDQFCKMFKCRHCPHVNMRRSNIVEHERMHGARDLKGEVFRCRICNYTCGNYGVLSVHLKMHQMSKSRTMQSQAPGESQQKGPPRPRREGSFLMHFCSMCPARFKGAKEINVHVKFHGAALPYPCELCDYAAQQKTHLLAHAKVHTSEYRERTLREIQYCPFSPDFPISKFYQEDAKFDAAHENDYQTKLQKSIIKNSPSGEKILGCPHCPGKFSKRTTLNRHIALHGSKYPHKCDLCDYAVSTRNHLAKHQGLHHGLDVRKKFKKRRRVLKEENLPGLWGLDTMEQAEEDDDDVPMSGIGLMEKLQKMESQRNEGDGEEVDDESSPTVVEDDPNGTDAVLFNEDLIFPDKIHVGHRIKRFYTCPKCPTVIQKKEKFKIHARLHGARCRYKCQLCDYAVKQFNHYAQHLRKHAESGDARAVEIQEQMNDSYSNVYKSSPRTDESPFQASGLAAALEVTPKIVIKKTETKAPNESHKTVYSVSTLSEPRSSISGDAKEKGKVEASAGPKATTTVRSCEEPRFYSCPSCPYSSAKRDHLKNHSGRHEVPTAQTGIFFCPYCNYWSQQASFVRDHVKVHFKAGRVPEKPLAFADTDEFEIWCIEEQENAHDSKESCLLKANTDAREVLLDRTADEQLHQFIDVASGEEVQLRNPVPVATADNESSKVR
ncbi:unnamed protein product [Darwinula stevensoni]|uniref:C2H2-type domain-containing protein n=1 Tax=Darwinula stevensoni TaxID=69355 RepID=A0A7R9AD88_9CRUS|nr:unnamed protein product [Darwinula stevensoni]CAG0901071.1 unnamed protein product [Darwinula stevensoni]